MGWEWHERRRDTDGKFMTCDAHYQLHVRVTWQQFQFIRGRAYARQLSLSDYIRDLIRRDLMHGRYPDLTIEMEETSDAEDV